jgi:hypothetical protein
MGIAFEITTADIENVLSQNATQVANTEGNTFEAMAESIHDDWAGGGAFDRIEIAALDGGTEMDKQTDAAYAEIRAILVEQGVLKR